MDTTPIQMPVVGTAWRDEDHHDNKVAQLYGGYVLPGSRFDVVGGFGLVVSQWNTESGWPYRAMQFKASVTDSTRRQSPRSDQSVIPRSGYGKDCDTWATASA